MIVNPKPDSYRLYKALIHRYCFYDCASKLGMVSDEYRDKTFGTTRDGIPDREGTTIDIIDDLMFCNDNIYLEWS